VVEELTLVVTDVVLLVVVPLVVLLLVVLGRATPLTGAPILA